MNRKYRRLVERGKMEPIPIKPQAVPEPQPVMEIIVQLMPNRQILVNRPSGEDHQHLLSIISLLLGAAQAMTNHLGQQMAKDGGKRIILPPAGVKVPRA